MRNLAIIGLGLIGGSIALEARQKGFAKNIIGVDQNAEHQQKALDLKLVDVCLDLEDMLATAPDLIILAIPVSAIQRLLPSLLDVLPEKSYVLDTGSTKSAICAQVAAHPNRQRFIAGHPIAGTEFSGPEAAHFGLFSAKNFIFCEVERSAEQGLRYCRELMEAIGAKAIQMDAENHDTHLAYISHLSHVSSFMLGQTVLDIEKDNKAIFQLAGSGFASTVRLAKSSPDMWAPIFMQNASILGAALQEYIIQLQQFQHALIKRDEARIKDMLLAANKIKQVLPDTQEKVIETKKSNHNEHHFSIH